VVGEPARLALGREQRRPLREVLAGSVQPHVFVVDGVGDLGSGDDAANCASRMRKRQLVTQHVMRGW